MPGLVPGIHVLLAGKLKNVDGRDKPGHDIADRAPQTKNVPVLSRDVFLLCALILTRCRD
jgi:hypothetical protein